jgi:hypothetical protein
MALVLNGFRAQAGPASYRNGISALAMERNNFQRGGSIRNFHAGSATGTLSEKAGFPNGAEGSNTWSLPRKGGGLAAYTTIVGTGALTASDLQPIFEIAGSMAGSGDLAGAMSLLSGMSASLAGAGDLAATLQALSNLAAEIGGSGDIDAAMGLLVSLEAVVSGAGTLNGSNLTGFANMSASILSYGELTPEGLRDAVWGAVLSNYPTAGTAGLALQTAGSGGVDYDTLWASMPAALKESLAAYVLAAAEAAPIDANVKQVNDVTLAGTGVAGDSMRPA